MDGAEVFSGACAAAITLVAPDRAAAAPAEFDAVTETRRACPTSPEPRRYVWSVAPAIDVQPVPAESQRLHWYEKSIGVLPLHEPLEEVSVCPARVVPETVGAELFEGGVAVARAVAPSAAPDATTLTEIATRAAIGFQLVIGGD